MVRRFNIKGTGWRKIMKDKILTEITDYCENCPKHECCPEEECVLFRIEQIVIKED